MCHCSNRFLREYLLKLVSYCWFFGRMNLTGGLGKTVGPREEAHELGVPGEE